MIDISRLILELRPDLRKRFAFHLPENADAFLGWFYTHGLEEHGYWRYLFADERSMVLRLSEPWQSRIQATLAKVALRRGCRPLRRARGRDGVRRPQGRAEGRAGEAARVCCV